MADVKCLARLFCVVVCYVLDLSCMCEHVYMMCMSMCNVCGGGDVTDVCKMYTVRNADMVHVLVHVHVCM